MLTPHEEIIRDLHPAAEHAFRRLTNDLNRSYEQGALDRELRPAEGFRVPREQERLFAQRPVITHHSKWRSPHSYGLAVYYRSVKPGGTQFQLKTSGHDQAVFSAVAKRHGLVVDANDATTVVHPWWYLEVQRVMARDTFTGRSDLV